MRGAVDDAVDGRLVHQFGQRDAGNVAEADERHHGVAVAAHDDAGHVLHRDVEFLRDEGAEAGAIQHAGHADDAVLAELGDPEGGLRHGVERIGDDDDDAVGRVLGNLLGGGPDDFVVGHQQIVAAHAGLAGKPGGDDGDIGIRGGLVIVRAGDA